MKVASVAVLAPAVRLAFPGSAAAAPPDRAVSYDGLLYRAGGLGRILKSADSGASWTVHSDLGDVYSVSKLSVDRKEGLLATVDYGTRAFTLSLGPDKRSWLTT